MKRSPSGELDWESGPERSVRDPNTSDLVEAVGAMAASVRALSVKQQSPGAGHAQRIGLDQSCAAFVPEFDKQVICCREAKRLERHADTPCRKGRRWRP